MKCDRADEQCMIDVMFSIAHISIDYSFDLAEGLKHLVAKVRGRPCFCVACQPPAKALPVPRSIILGRG